MTLRDIPIVSTIFVLAAAATMVALGVWQLGRADEKAALIEAHQTALAQEDVVEIEYGRPGLDYRTVRMNCQTPGNWQAVAGRNARGQTGYAHRYSCSTTITPIDARVTVVDVGWSRAPSEPGFEGGVIEGMMVTTSAHKIVASQPLEGLEPLAKPDPNDLPNNHLAYAGQWFFFAITALVIYWLALRSRASKRTKD